MNTIVVILVMKNGKKNSYQVNPDGSECYNKDRKVTRSFIRAVNIAKMEAKKTNTSIKFVEIDMPEELKKSESKKAPEAPNDSASNK